MVDKQRLIERLVLATTRVDDAKREQIWSISAAHSAGLSIRQISSATGLSSSRVHQLLHTDEAHSIPDWLNKLDEGSHQVNISESKTNTEFQQKLAGEAEVLRWCVEWLEQLKQGKKVVVNLRAPCDAKTAHVRVDQKWVQRVLKRVAADLDNLSGQQTPTDAGADGDAITAGTKHRYRLGEPEPELSSLSQKEQRAIVREKIGL